MGKMVENMKNWDKKLLDSWNINAEWLTNECTGAMVTGSTSAKGNLVGQTSDLMMPYWQSIRVELVVPQEGYRYLRFINPAMGSMAPLNEKGVGLTWYFRGARTIPYVNGRKPKYITENELLRQSDSAKKYVELLSESITRYGIGVPNGAAARLLVDPKEGYLLEAANWVYGDPANHAIHGPMTDQVFAHANFYISKRLKQVETGVGTGYNRAKRMWELLIDRQYDSITGRNTGISLAYLMGCFRDHGNMSAEKGRLSFRGVPEERGKYTICTHGLASYSAHAHICAVTTNFTDLFSCLWLTFGQPCLSPFLPIYIGINEVPEVMKTTALAEVFEQLRLAVEYHPECREEIMHFWKIFDIHTVEESSTLEAEVTALADEKNQGEVRKRLTEFVKTKSNQALSEAKFILADIMALPRFRKPLN
jgi:hypothetical protein